MSPKGQKFSQSSQWRGGTLKGFLSVERGQGGPVGLSADTFLSVDRGQGGPVGLSADTFLSVDRGQGGPVGAQRAPSRGLGPHYKSS